MELPDRWTPFRPHPAGEAYSQSPHRFNVVSAGRRSGKTERAKRKLVIMAMEAATEWVPRFFAAAPTRDQAHRIFWDDLKALVPKEFLARRPSESNLMIQIINGAEIWVVGMDKPERIEGQPWDGGVLDELANMKPTAWAANVRPSLSDRLGWCDLIGVPEGRNHYYEIDRAAKAMMLAEGVKSEWGSYTWPSSDVLPPSEVEAAKRDLDELTFLQEYEGSFISFEGRAYYVFDERLHCKPLKYDPRQHLALCFDFNVEPGVCAVCQEQALPGQYEQDKNGATLLDKPVIGTGVIGEVYIPRNSNTPAVCRKIIQDWGKHPGQVNCYGDATGGARGSAKVQGSDWELIRQELKPVFGDRLVFRVKSSNPAERARINAVNSRLKSSSGTIRMMVDPSKAPYVVKDFEGVQLLKGGSGEIDKKATPALTHMCFAAGTMVELETGACAIEQAPKTGKVRTWDGSFVSYKNVGKTRTNVNTISACISDGTVVYCTPDHLFLTSRGWICAEKLKGKTLSGWQSLLTHLPVKPLTGKNSIGMMEKNGILEGRVARVNNTFIGLSGRFIMAPLQRALMSTIWMERGLTTRLKTLNCYFQRLILGTTSTLILKGQRLGGALAWNLPAKLRRHGIKALRVINGMLLMDLRSQQEPCPVSAHTVGPISCQPALPYFAVENARQEQDITPELTTKQERVPYVERPFQSTAIQKPCIAAGSAPQELRVISVSPAGRNDVYCLNVPIHGCFALANGAIVSNSDALGYRVEHDFPIVKQLSRMQISGT
jgi:hypothetical protein